MDICEYKLGEEWLAEDATLLSIEAVVRAIQSPRSFILNLQVRMTIAQNTPYGYKISFYNVSVHYNLRMVRH